jgi:hypothetical protein
VAAVLELPPIPTITRRQRAQRARRLVAQLGQLEQQMRNCCAELLEITEPGEDLAETVARLLVALEG